MVIERSTINSNTAQGGGGISSTSAGTLSLDHSALDDNVATRNPSSSGGGLGIWGGSAHFTNSEVMRNQATTAGAIAAGGGAVVTLDQTTVQGNSTPQCNPASLC